MRSSSLNSTWIATAAPISYVGANPVFADVDPVSWCLDAEAFEAAITPRTRAVIPVDLYGGVPDWAAIRDVAVRHGIAIVEDAAEAIGSLYHGQRAGSFGDAGVFSFHGSKTLTTGEGGMLVTDRDDIRDRVLVLRDHGRRPGDTLFRNGEVAFKYKMSGLQAALGLAQLERVDDLVERKRAIFDGYRHELADIEGLTLNAEPDGTLNAYWMSTVIIDPAFGRTKEEVITELRADGVDCRPFFYPLSSLDAYQQLSDAATAERRNPTAYRLSAGGVNLPSALSLTEGDIEAACATLRRALGIR